MIGEYFIVRLSPNLYLGLPVVDLEEVSNIRQKSICTLPGIAPFWLGVINQKGNLVWILDLLKLLEISPQSDYQATNFTTVIVRKKIDGSWRKAGVIVQRLEGVLEIKNPEYLDNDVLEKYQKLAQTVVKYQENPLIILNTEAFFKLIHSS